MKNFILLAFISLLAGCGATYPPATNLQFQASSPDSGKYAEGVTAALKGHDARSDQAIVRYRLPGKTEVGIANRTAPHLLITKQLADGLAGQGLTFKADSPVRLQLDIKELSVLVTRPGLLYRAQARSLLALSVQNRGTTLTKTYNRETKQEWVRRPAVSQLEEMINGQLRDIVSQMLKDPECRTIISGSGS